MREHPKSGSMRGGWRGRQLLNQSPALQSHFIPLVDLLSCERATHMRRN